MLHETGTLIYDKNAGMRTPSGDSAVFLCTEHEVLLKDGDGLVLPNYSQASPLCDAFEYVFTMDGRAFYVGFPRNETGLDGFSLRTLRDVRLGGPGAMIYACATGHHLYKWYRSRTFCGVCGQTTERGKKERMVLCPACGHIEYPTIMPAVIVGIIHGDDLLLTRIKGGMPGRPGLVSGFVEIGETLEETVVREVQEETGLSVKDVTYYKSQPWSFSGTLLAGFFVRLNGSPNINPDDDELEDAYWVNRRDIDVRFDGISLTNEMICLFAKEGGERLLRHDLASFAP